MFFLSQRMIPTNVDHFLCCGTSYRDLRNSVGQVLLENRSDSFVTELQVRATPELKQLLTYVALCLLIATRGQQILIILTFEKKSLN